MYISKIMYFYEKKLINGKLRNIYKKKGSNIKYIKSNNKFVKLQDYKTKKIVEQGH